MPDLAALLASPLVINASPDDTPGDLEAYVQQLPVDLVRGSSSFVFRVSESLLGDIDSAAGARADLQLRAGNAGLFALTWRSLAGRYELHEIQGGGIAQPAVGAEHVAFIAQKELERMVTKTARRCL